MTRNTNAHGADSGRNREILGENFMFPPRVIDDIHIKAELGRLPHARHGALQDHPDLGRSHLPPGHSHPFRDRGLPREVPDPDRDRTARQAAAGSGYPGLCHRDELRRPELRGEDGACPRRNHGGHGDLLGRRRHDPRRTALFGKEVLPVHPVALRLQSPSPETGRRLRVLHRPRGARSVSAGI